MEELILEFRKWNIEWDSYNDQDGDKPLDINAFVEDMKSKFKVTKKQYHAFTFALQLRQGFTSRSKDIGLRRPKYGLTFSPVGTKRTFLAILMDGGIKTAGKATHVGHKCTDPE